MTEVIEMKKYNTALNTEAEKISVLSSGKF